MTKKDLQPKLVLATLTAKYIHSSLALRYLREACRHLPINIKTQEYHINMPPLDILSGIYEEKPDILGFSCYIWNITQTLELATMIKQIWPNCQIILGGPEVSYDADSLLAAQGDIDFIISGEGEESFPQLLTYLTEGSGSLRRIPGLTYRLPDGTIASNPPESIKDLSQVPSAYSEEGLKNLENKLVYLETSRGCPFSCRYCLSSRSRGVRYFPLNRVKQEIRALVENKCSQIKFVDRTFNCHKERAMELWRFMRDLPGDSIFHFEIDAELLDDDMLQLLATVPAGKFQFEIGVQTTTEDSLAVISRRQDWNKLAETVSTLTNRGNIETHLDLIAGLPQDTLPEFGQALDRVFSLKPTRIQLGFLKVLKGSGLWYDSQELGLVYQGQPPYEILTTPTMSYDDLRYLKQVELLVESYYNTHRFDLTLDLVVTHLYDGSFMAFLEDFAKYWLDRGLFSVAHKQYNLYRFLAEFFRERHRKDAWTLEAMLYDYAAKEPRRDLPVLGSKPRDLKLRNRDTYHRLIEIPLAGEIYPCAQGPAESAD